jgi:ATP-dependent exoDNAse (exonuclease V) beta subunit
MKFNHLKGYESVTLPTETIDGKRYYTTPEGNNYPSVTSVTGLMNRKGIEAWRKWVGEEQANKISSQAANRGTRYHYMMEDFINNIDIDEKLSKATPLDQMMFNQTREITEKLGDIYMLEGSLYSDELMMAGRVDCIADFAGKVSVIDFKTSTKRKTQSRCKSYFVQETAYAKMFEERYQIPIERIVTIVAVEETGQSQLFVEEPSKWYDHLLDLRTQYKTEFGL